MGGVADEGGPGAGVPRPLVIVGAGGHGRELLDIVEALDPAVSGAGAGRQAPPFVVVGVLADDPADADVLARRRVRVVGSVADHTAVGAEVVALGVGISEARQAVAGRIRLPVVTLVHPAAVLDAAVAEGAGEGLVVAAGASVAAGVRLGRHVHLNVNATVAGGAQLDDFVTLGPGTVVAERARLGRAAFVGAGAVIGPGVQVGPGAVVGAGAEVVSDVPAGARVVGRSAR